MGIKNLSTNPKKLKRTKLPGHELTKQESRTPDKLNAMLHGIDPDEWRELSADMEKNGWGYPFSETEEEVEAMIRSRARSASTCRRRAEASPVGRRG